MEEGKKGSGDFSIGSTVWPGTCKLLEEAGETVQVLGKLIAVHGQDKHWDGDLRARLIEELGDLMAAINFFQVQNLSAADMKRVAERERKKFALFLEWHEHQTMP